MRRLLAAGGLALLLFPALGRAAPQAGTVPSESEVHEWVRRLETAQEAAEQARQRLARAEAAVQRQRQRHYPRGEAKRALDRELEEAQASLGIAGESLQELVEQARRAGVPWRILGDYEELDSNP